MNIDSPRYTNIISGRSAFRRAMHNITKMGKIMQKKIRIEKPVIEDETSDEYIRASVECINNNSLSSSLKVLRAINK